MQMNTRDKYDEQSSRWLDVIYIAIDKERREVELEAEKCKRNGEMYGWNFNKGLSSGMTRVDLSVRETIRPVFAAALREAGQREAELRMELGAWQRAFQTTQLTHAQARLEKAESSVAQLQKYHDEAFAILRESEAEVERLKAEVDEMKDDNRRVKDEARKLGLL